MITFDPSLGGIFSPPPSPRSLIIKLLMKHSGFDSIERLCQVFLAGSM